MKKITVLILIIFATMAFYFREDLLSGRLPAPIASLVFGNGPIGADSPEHLLELYQKYHSMNDKRNMLKLYNMEEVPPHIRKYELNKLTGDFKRKIIKAENTKLARDARDFFSKAHTVQGQTVQYNMPVEGQLTVDFAQNRTTSLLYGQKDGKYFFAVQKNVL